jgi:hypothetical protein
LVTTTTTTTDRDLGTSGEDWREVYTDLCTEGMRATLDTLATLELG